MGLENHNITSGEQYAKLLTSNIRESYAILGEIGEESLIDYWCEEITKLCIIRYSEYIAGDIDSFMLSEEDVKDLYEKSKERLISETLEELLSRGDISMGVRNDGEIVYSTTEKGKRKLKNYEKKNKKK